MGIGVFVDLGGVFLYTGFRFFVLARETDFIGIFSRIDTFFENYISFFRDIQARDVYTGNFFRIG